MAHYAYYNEFDPYVAQWLRNLIAAGVIMPGFVDERSIEDVKPDDLIGFTQVHLFAGIGGWSYALRRARWPDSRRVWTASCPCQPFSAAGKGNGFDDQRHLWPHTQYLASIRKPSVIIGEQVASKDAEPWIDLVHTDLENLGYAFGCVPFPSAGVGAPHIRDRNYWAAIRVVDSDHAGLEGWDEHACRCADQQLARAPGMAVSLADTNGEQHDRCGVIWTGRRSEPSDRRDTVGLADTAIVRSPSNERAQPGISEGSHRIIGNGSDAIRPGPTNGIWRDADWLGCTDGKWRPVEPSSFPLANGVPGRVGRLRAYGNAINPEAALVFIQSLTDVLQY